MILRTLGCVRVLRPGFAVLSSVLVFGPLRIVGSGFYSWLIFRRCVCGSGVSRRVYRSVGSRSIVLPRSILPFGTITVVSRVIIASTNRVPIHAQGGFFVVVLLNLSLLLSWLWTGCGRCLMGCKSGCRGFFLRTFFGCLTRYRNTVSALGVLRYAAIPLASWISGTSRVVVPIIPSLGSL